MEIVLGVIVVLAVLAFLGRETRPPTRAQAVLLAPMPHPPPVAQERADDAFVMGYALGRHAADGSSTGTGGPRFDPAPDDCDQDELDMAMYDGAWDD